MADGVVSDVASAAIRSVLSHAVVCAIAAKVVPDVLTAHIRAGFISPAKSVKIDGCAAAIVADELSVFVNVGVLVSPAPVVEVHVVEEVAAVVARVLDERSEGASLFRKQCGNCGLCHLDYFYFCSYYFLIIF